jgi:phage terminase large subunit-like protein
MPLTLAQKIILFIEKYLIIPEGDLVGQPVRLSQFQKDFLIDVFDNPHGTKKAIFSIARKNAKCLALDTPIPTPSGWVQMRDIVEGSQVYGADGLPVTVLAVSDVYLNKPCYRVGFSDGSFITATDDHLWTTKHKFRPWQKGGKNLKNGANRKPVIDNVTTEQIFNSLSVERVDSATEWNHSVPVSPQLVSAAVDLPCPPYLLGYWLGDGTTKNTSITCGEQDLNDFISRLNNLGIAATVHSNKTSAPTVKPDKTGRDYIRSAGVIDNKHIPELYFNSGTGQRWALLQGLMDSDGSVHQHAGQTTARCSYATTIETLANGVWRLAKSLGLKATITSYQAKLYGVNKKRCYRVSFPATIDQPVFSYERKQKLLPSALGNRSKSIQIISCEKIDPVPTKCIMVDSPDSLYLCGHGCIPTHNTALIAFIVIVFLVGPMAKRNSRIASGALALKQAAEVFNLASKCVNLSPKIRDLIHINPSAKKMTGLLMGTEYAALSAEAKIAHGNSLRVVIIDEPGQIDGPTAEFFHVLTTSQAAYKDAITFYIGTQASKDSDFFSLLIDDARKNKPPRTVCHVHEAPKDCEIMDESAWYLANPALGLFRSMDDMREQAEEAARMPSKANMFRNLCLNQRVSTVSTFIPVDAWKRCCVNYGIPDGSKVYGGLDLSKRTDLCSFSLACEVDGQTHVETWFFAPEVGVDERSHRDMVRYDLWAADGYLILTPGATVDYDFVVATIMQIMSDRGFAFEKLGCDPWRFDVFKSSVDRAEIELPLVKIGQGYKYMSPAIEKVEELFLGDKLKHLENPVQTMCAANAITTKNATGFRMLDKSKTTGRMDGIVAMTIAIAAGLDSTKVEEKEQDMSDYISDPIIGTRKNV